MNLFNNIKKAKNGFYFDNPYNIYQDAINIPLHTGLGYGVGKQIATGMGYDEKTQRRFGTMSAFNNALNSTATFLNNRTREKEVKENIQEEYLDDFYYTPYDRYSYDSASSTPYYAKDGGKLDKKAFGGVIGASPNFILNGAAKISGGNAFKGISDSNHLSVLNRSFSPVPNPTNTNKRGHVYGKIHGQTMADQRARGLSYYQDGGKIPTSSRGLWDFPNQPVRVPSNNITMKGISYPVMAFPNGDRPKLMQPGKEYSFPNSKEVLEVPMLRDGGDVEKGFWEQNHESEIYDSTFSNENNNMDYQPSIQDTINDGITSNSSVYEELYIEDPNNLGDSYTFDLSNFIPRVINTPTNSSPSNLNELRTDQGNSIKKGLINRGFTNDETAAIMGNLKAESDFNPAAINPKSKALGLMQWLGSRKKDLISKHGDTPSLDNQLDYIAWELRGGNEYETRMFRRAMKSPTVEGKTFNFGKYVERPSDEELTNSLATRTKYANIYR